MAAAYLDWLTDVFEEAQVPYGAEAAPYLDEVVRRIAGVDAAASDEAILAIVNKRWIRHGPSGRQLLAGLIRGQVFANRASPLRPKEGMGYFTNDQLRD
jgi:hypothetical protein